MGDCGQYYGLGGAPCPYYGEVEGRNTLQLPGVTLCLDELNVIDHSEPILLLGADAMIWPLDADQWAFESIGVHPTKGGGLSLPATLTQQLCP